jgi:transposase
VPWRGRSSPATFGNRRQLGSYLGLTPSAYDSGSASLCQGISNAGNSRARRMAIEIAWLWRKYQPGKPVSRWRAAKMQEQAPRIRRIT